MNRYSIGEAAKALGVTQQAIHNRINRGKIRHERGEDGKQYVFLTDDELSDKQGEHMLPSGVFLEYIESLKAEIESLKRDQEERREEARRKDHIIMALTSRIPELEAAEEPRESTVTATEEDGKGRVPPEPQNRSWWRRLLQ